MVVLQAPYARWKDLIRQELDPITGVLLGRLRVRGHLPQILKWTDSIAVLVRLAGLVETEFVDDVAGAVRA